MLWMFHAIVWRRLGGEDTCEGLRKEEKLKILLQVKKKRLANWAKKFSLRKALLRKDKNYFLYDLAELMQFFISLSQQTWRILQTFSFFEQFSLIATFCKFLPTKPKNFKIKKGCLWNHSEILLLPFSMCKLCMQMCLFFICFFFCSPIRKEIFEKRLNMLMIINLQLFYLFGNFWKVLVEKNFDKSFVYFESSKLGKVMSFFDKFFQSFSKLEI